MYAPFSPAGAIALYMLFITYKTKTQEERRTILRICPVFWTSLNDFVSEQFFRLCP